MANDLNLRVRVQTADAKSELASFRGDVESLATRVKSLTQSIVIGASLDASNVLAGIANIKRATNDISFVIKPVIDESAFKNAIGNLKLNTTQALDDFSSFKSLVNSANLTANLKLNTTQALNDLSAFKASANNANLSIDIRANTGIDKTINGISDAVNKLTSSVVAGKPAIDAYNRALNELANSGRELGKSLNSQQIKDSSDHIKRLGAESAHTGEAIGFLKEALVAAFSIETLKQAGELTNEVIKTNTELNRLSASLNMSRNALQVWQLAGKTFDVDVADKFKDISEKIAEFATTGGGEALDFFKRTKMDVKELIALAPDQQFVKIAQALDKLKGVSHGEKIFLLEGLADDSSKLLPLLEDNAKKLREFDELARKSRAIISPEQVKVLDEASKKTAELNLYLQGLKNEFSTAGASLLNEFSAGFVNDIVAMREAIPTLVINIKTIANSWSYAAESMRRNNADWVNDLNASLDWLMKNFRTGWTYFPVWAEAAFSASGDFAQSFVDDAQSKFAAFNAIVDETMVYLPNAGDLAFGKLKVIAGDAIDVLINRLATFADALSGLSSIGMDGIAESASAISSQMKAMATNGQDAQAELNRAYERIADDASNASEANRKLVQQYKQSALDHSVAAWNYLADAKKYQDASEKQRSAALASGKAVKELTGAFGEAGAAAGNFYVNQDAINKALAENVDKTKAAVDVAEKHANAVKSAIEAIEKQRIAIQFGDRAAQYYIDRLNGLNDAEAKAKASAEQYNDILGIRKQLDLDAKGIGAGLRTKFKIELESKGVTESAVQFGAVKTQVDIAVEAQSRFNKLVQDTKTEIEKMGDAYKNAANDAKSSMQSMSQSVSNMATNISSGFTGSVTASGKMMRDMQANAQAYAQSIATINRVSAQTGTDATLMKTMAWIESRFNSTASRGAAGAKGLYQFVPGTAAQYGIAGQELNVEASTQAYVKLLQNNIKALQKYGIEINSANLYLAHQQGAGGLKQIIDAASGRGEMSSKVAANMRNNLLPGVDNSPIAFLDSWRKKYAEIESGVKQVFGATQKTTEATKQAATTTGALSDHTKQQASTTARIIPFWETIGAKTKTSKEHVIEYGRAIQGAGVDAKNLAEGLADQRMENEMNTLIANATKQAGLLQDTGYEIRKNELLQLEFNKAQAQAVLTAESNLIYLQEERKIRLEMATIKAGGGMAATYRAGLNDKTLSADQKDRLTGQYTELQYTKQSEDNKAQILQLRLTEQAYQRIKLAKDGYSKSQIAGLVAQRQEIQLLEQARQAGYRGADGFVNMTRVKAIAATGFLQSMVGGVANANRTMFEINKAASIANALLNAKESVVGAYKFGAAIGGPWLGATFGAVAAAAQAANVAAIASQSFGGGGSIGSTGGSTSVGAGGTDTGSATTSGTDKAKDAPTVTIALEGSDNSSYSKKQVRELIKKINDAVGDGARLRVA